MTITLTTEQVFMCAGIVWGLVTLAFQVGLAIGKLLNKVARHHDILELHTSEIKELKGEV